ncbi:MAG: hypothetical protein ACLQT7_01595 [Candidatus Dormibacteria bacterium]
MADHHGGVASKLAAVAIAAVLVATSALTLGPPNLTMAGDFLSGGFPSMAAAVAFLSLLCYTVVLGVAGVALVGGLRMRTRGRRGGPTSRAAAVVLAGAVLLGLSVANRAASGGAICCGGGPQQVREVVSLAR